ncbi:MAG: hypothetical protein JRN39_05935 [Nitrososphaerota archaeon]|nr:hypothetical protein [Nitrososphaerota archaeon]
MPKTTIVGEVLQVRMGRRRIELIIAPQDDRPESGHRKATRASGDEELEEEVIEQRAGYRYSTEPTWSFYLSRTMFEALGRPTVESEVLVTISRLH